MEAVTQRDKINKRWVFFGTFFGYVVYTLSRRSFTYSMPALMDDLHLEKSQLGVITSAWSLAYGIAKFAGGVLSDRLSPGWFYALGLAASGLSCMLFSMSNGVAAFASLWFISGVFQGFGWPAITQLVNNWCGGMELASWWSALSSAGNIGLTLAPFVITNLVAMYGWRVTFFGMGCLSLAVSALLPFVISDAPVSPLSPRSERSKRGASPSRASVLELCRNRMILLVSLAYFLVSLIKEGWSNWGLLYLIQSKQMESGVAGSIMFLFEAGGICGSLVTGFASDYALKLMNVEGSAVARIPLTFLAALWAFLAYVLLHWFANSLILLYVSAFSIGCSAYGIICLLGVMSLEAAPRSLAGAAHAVTALAGQMGGLSAGFPLGWMATHYQWYGAGNVLILTAAAIPVLLAVSYTSFRMQPTRKVAQD